MKTHRPTAELISEDAWFKSSYSDPGQNCLEIADLTATPRTGIAVRDSKNPQGPALLLHPSSWSAFVAHASRTGTPNGQ
ncbi:DUF397 domain-containing protein [Streptomyces sp. NPDC004732]|uniref:DUF397 domain-containing protein n=1 Tax=Streptomyces sp. NPDC004732 TaxID=3154290 RepID=UPI0033A8C673